MHHSTINHGERRVVTLAHAPFDNKPERMSRSSKGVQRANGPLDSGGLSPHTFPLHNILAAHLGELTGTPDEPPTLGRAIQGGPTCVGPPFSCVYFSLSASSSTVCFTFTGLPSLSRPPRICMTQPGQSMATRGAPVFLMFSNLRARMGLEISGNFSE